MKIQISYLWYQVGPPIDAMQGETSTLTRKVALILSATDIEQLKTIQKYQTEYGDHVIVDMPFVNAQTVGGKLIVELID